MKLGDAIVIAKNINKEMENCDTLTKGEAIYEILQAETLNSVTKNELIQIIQWLWDMCFEVSEQDD